jgi:hypothetical protein
VHDKNEYSAELSYMTGALISNNNKINGNEIVQWDFPNSANCMHAVSEKKQRNLVFAQPIAYLRLMVAIKNSESLGHLGWQFFQKHNKFVLTFTQNLVVCQYLKLHDRIFKKFS